MSVIFPLPQQETPTDAPVDEDFLTLDTPILIVCGGPVGMLFAYILSSDSSPVSR